MTNNHIVVDLTDVPLDRSPLRITLPSDINEYMFDWEGTSALIIIFGMGNEVFDFGYLCIPTTDFRHCTPIGRIYDYREGEFTLTSWHDDSVHPDAAVLLEHLEKTYPSNHLKGLDLLDCLAETYILPTEARKRYLLADTRVAVLLVMEATATSAANNVPEHIRSYLAPILKRITSPGLSTTEKQALEEYLSNVSLIPWNNYINVDTTHIDNDINKSHYALTLQKRILRNILSIYQKTKYFPQCICFVGPPGVGKTSLIRSLANSSNLPVSIIPLAGMTDVHQLTGFHRSYSKSSYGKIIDALITGKAMNPIIVFDEIDKASDAIKNLLLHILDPENKDLFIDSYFNFPINLNNVIFFATANDIHELPEPLRDRLLIVEIKNYSREEKINLIKSYVIPKLTNRLALSIHIEDEVLALLAKLDSIRDIEKHIYQSILEQEINSDAVCIYGKSIFTNKSIGF
jgi:GTPase SAR1 family protein